MIAGRRSDSPKNAMPMTTASDAPMLTPRMPGSASGLRVTPCITAPDSPSAAPTSTASTVRGIRLVDRGLADAVASTAEARRRCRPADVARAERDRGGA